MMPPKSIIWDEALLRHQDFDFSVRFAEKFSFLPSKEVTCIVHWTKGEKRLEDVDSQIRFIKKHKQKISPEIYNMYHSGIYSQIQYRKDLSEDTLRYFKKESARFIQAISLNEYLSLNKEGKGKLGRLLLRVKYIVKVFFN